MLIHESSQLKAKKKTLNNNDDKSPKQIALFAN